MLDATLIVPTQNRAELLAISLPRMLSQSLETTRYEVVVVDDESTDSTPAVATQLACDHLRYLRVARGGGVARLRNRGLDVARGEVVIFLDDDAFVGPHFVREHLALHRDAPAMVAGGIVQVRRIPDHVEESPGWRAYHRHPMPGGNSSVRVADIRRAGGYDESFDTFGWQDQELAERLFSLGLRRRFAWRAPIYHYKPASYDMDMRLQLSRELDRGRMGARFYRKHPRALIGITTKLWPPLGTLDRLATRMFSLDDLATAILRGERAHDPIPEWKAALLRAHVEMAAGQRELDALARSTARSSAGYPASAADAVRSSLSAASTGRSSAGYPASAASTRDARDDSPEYL
jgi:GT2 family glycosyltransferase